MRAVMRERCGTAMAACDGAAVVRRGIRGRHSDSIRPSAPTVTLAAPPGTTVNRTVALTATPTAAAGVTSVEFLVDGAVIGTVTAAPYTTNWDTSTSRTAFTA